MASNPKRRKVKIVSANITEVIQEQPIELKDINWELCFICQTIKNEKDLRCPHNNVAIAKEKKAEFIRNSYQTLANNIISLNDIDEMPVLMKQSLLSNQINLVECLQENMAKYHKNCKKLFDNDKVDRARLRRKSDENKTSEMDNKRNLRSSNEPEKPILCFFCEKKQMNVHYMQFKRFVLMLKLDRQLLI